MNDGWFGPPKSGWRPSYSKVYFSVVSKLAQKLTETIDERNPAPVNKNDLVTMDFQWFCTSQVVGWISSINSIFSSRHSIKSQLVKTEGFAGPPTRKTRSIYEGSIFWWNVCRGFHGVRTEKWWIYLRLTVLLIVELHWGFTLNFSNVDRCQFAQKPAFPLKNKQPSMLHNQWLRTSDIEAFNFQQQKRSESTTVTKWS